jgi:hypothetical protein
MKFGDSYYNRREILINVAKRQNCYAMRRPTLPNLFSSRSDRWRKFSLKTGNVVSTEKAVSYKFTEIKKEIIVL